METKFETNDISARLLRGFALLELRKGPEAAAQFKAINSAQGRFPLWIGRCMARLGYARALAMAGDNSGAKVAYQNFLVFWKDADPDLPLFKQAKNEYAKLATN